MKYKLQDLIDIDKFQSLQDRLNVIYPFPSAIIDNEGTILTATAWQDICTKFHRQNKECEKECIKSDLYILEHLSEADPAVSYRCPHGLIDNALPIIVDGQHLGNFFTGQFFLEEPDLEFFREQADRFGFDKDAYIQAVKRVPVWNREQLDSYLLFIKEMIDVISTAGLKNLKEMKAAKELQQSEKKFRSLFEQAGDYILVLEATADGDLVVIDANQAACRIHGYSRDEFIGISIKDLDRALTEDQVKDLLDRTMAGESVLFQTKHQKSDGSVFPVEVSTTLLDTGDGKPLITSVERDITERKLAEERIERQRLFLEKAQELGRIGTWELDIKENVLRWTDENYRIFRVPRGSEVNFEIFTSRIHPDDREYVAREWKASCEGKPYDIEHRLLIDGITTWVREKADIEYDADGVAIRAIGFTQDITERKLAEEMLEASNTRFRSLVELLPEAVFETDQDLTITFANYRAFELFGYSEEDIVNGLNGLAVIAPEFHDRVRTNITLRAEGINPGTVEYVGMRKDGSTFPILFHAGSIVRDGVLVGLRGVIVDISQLKQAEKELADSERQLSALVHQSPIAYEIYDADGLQLSVNPAYEQMYGMKAKDSVGSFNVRTDPQVELLGLKPFVDRAYSGESVKLPEFEWDPGKSGFPGRTRWLSTRIYPLLDEHGAVQNIVITHEDTTERKNAENALVLSEDRHRIILQTMMNGFWIAGKDGHLIEVNNVYCQMSGYSEQELLSMSISDIEAMEAGSDTSKRIDKVISQGEDRFESRHRRKDGSTFDVEVSVQYRPGETGQLVVFIQDISKRKSEEFDKQKLESQLQQAQKLESVGRLAGGVAHDFNNMLGVILGHAEFALDQLDMDHPLSEGLQEIRKAAQRSVDLTQQLLAFARKQTVVPKVVDINETIEGMLSMLSRLIGENISLTWNPHGNLWPVRIDPSQIDQILANLCVNARDAIDGVGRVTIETNTATFDPAYCAQHPEFQPGEYVLFSVGDNGTGIDEETMETLFEPFFTTKPVGAGTGLGLSMVYGVVKQNNGFIVVQSEPGEGAIFKIYLPRSDGKSVGRNTRIETGPLPTGDETILIVEDEEAILHLTKTVLEKLGYTVLTANTPDEALRRAAAHPGDIQLLITDVVMPEMNGRELSNSMLEHYPHLKRLFMSGYTADIIARNGVLEEGMFFIQKPFSTTALAAKVRGVLDDE